MNYWHGCHQQGGGVSSSSGLGADTPLNKSTAEREGVVICQKTDSYPIPKNTKNRRFQEIQGVALCLLLVFKPQAITDQTQALGSENR